VLSLRRLQWLSRHCSIDEVDAEEMQNHTAEDEIGECSVNEKKN
jgi:hypothetical protein